MNETRPGAHGRTRMLMMTGMLALLAGLLTVPVRSLFGVWQEARAFRTIEDRTDGFSRRLEITEATFGRYERSVQMLESAARAVPSSSRYPRQIADLLAQLGVWTRTMETLEGDRRAPARTAASFLDDAKRQLLTAVRLDPLRAEQHLALGHICAEQGDVDEARREYQRAIQAHPLNSPLRYAVAMELLLAGSTDDALREARILARNDDSYRMSESIVKQRMIELHTPEFDQLLQRSYLYSALEIIWRSTGGSADAVRAAIPDDADARRVLEAFLLRKGLAP